MSVAVLRLGSGLDVTSIAEKFENLDPLEASVDSGLGDIKGPEPVS
jgi:hypothetical protein